MDNHITRGPSEIDEITATAKSRQDSAALMLNLNHYTAAAGFPDGSEYKTYMAELEKSVGRVGGKALWRTPVSGQPVGCEHDGVCRDVPATGAMSRQRCDLSLSW